jgi:excinuclease ABC subunit A
LRDLDVDVPLWRTVAVVGVSGSGKTSLAIGTLYAEGTHRFLQRLSTYSRRRLPQSERPVPTSRVSSLLGGERCVVMAV